MQAVGEGGDEGPRHKGGKASLVEGLGGGQGHGSHCTPVKGTLHTKCACSEQHSMPSATENAPCSTNDQNADKQAGTSDRYECFSGNGLILRAVGHVFSLCLN